MILAVAAVILKNVSFDEALDRTMRYRKVLQSRLKSIDVRGRYNLLSLVISDYAANTFRVNSKPVGDIFQVFVGYDVQGDYPKSRDRDIIALIAGWIRRAFNETPGYAEKRTELLDIVNSWEAESLASAGDTSRNL